VLKLGVLNISFGFLPNLISHIQIERHNNMRQFSSFGAKRVKFSQFFIPEFVFEFGRFISPTILKEILQFELNEFQKVLGGI